MRVVSKTMNPGSNPGSPASHRVSRISARPAQGSVVTLDGGLDNRTGPWPRTNLVDARGVPTEARRWHHLGLDWSRAKCCGCTEAFQASRAGSIPVARLTHTGSGAVW